MHKFQQKITMLGSLSYLVSFFLYQECMFIIKTMNLYEKNLTPIMSNLT